MKLNFAYSDELYHYGVKGMRWGVRRGRNGSRFEEDKPGRIAKFLAKRSKKAANNLKRSTSISIKDKNDKKVGSLYLRDDNDGSLNLEWLNVSNEHRGKGYGSSAIDNVIKYAKDAGYKKLTCEVVGNSPDMRHICEKYGFKKVKTLSTDDVWGGLTAMELNLDNERSIKHSDELCHYGVKGMKWGVRKQRTSSGKKRRSRMFMNDELVNQRHEELRKKDLKLKKLKKELDSAEQDCLNALVNVNVNPKGKKWRSLLDDYDTSAKAYNDRDSELRDRAEKYAIQRGVNKAVDTTRKANKVGYEVHKVRLML